MGGYLIGFRAVALFEGRKPIFCRFPQSRELYITNKWQILASGI